MPPDCSFKPRPRTSFDGVALATLSIPILSRIGDVPIWRSDQPSYIMNKTILWMRISQTADNYPRPELTSALRRPPASRWPATRWRGNPLPARSAKPRLTKPRRNPMARFQLRRAACNRGGVAERLKAADCKSADVRLRRFESYPLHQRSVRQDRRVG